MQQNISDWNCFIRTFSDSQRPRSVNPELPSELNQVLQRALKKAPGDRFKTCLEFAGALDLALCSHNTSLPSNASRSPRAPRKAFWGRRRAALAGIAALLLATLAISGIFVHSFFPRWLGDSRSSNTPAKIDPSNQTLPAMVPRRTSKPSDRSKVDNIPKETVSPEQSIQNIQPIGRTIVAAVEKSPEDTTADISKSFSVGTKQDFKGDATAKLKSLQKDPQTVLKNTEQDTRLPVSPSPPPESAKLKQLSPPIPDFDVSWTPVVPVVPLHPPISPFPPLFAHIQVGKSQKTRPEWCHPEYKEPILNPYPITWGSDYGDCMDFPEIAGSVDHGQIWSKEFAAHLNDVIWLSFGASQK